MADLVMHVYIYIYIQREKNAGHHLGVKIRGHTCHAVVDCQYIYIYKKIYIYIYIK
jgi:hypothetical protein